MRLNYRKKNKKGRVLFLLFLFFIILYYGSSWILKESFYIKTFWLKLITDKQEVLDENLRLNKELKELKIKNSFANYYFFEYKKLADRLDYLEEHNIKRKVFRTFNSGDLFWNSTNVFKGSGLKVNDKVYFSKNFLLGKIDKLNGKLAYIKYFSAPNYKNNFIIFDQGEEKFKGVGEGESLGLIKVDLPRDLVLSDKAILILDDGSGDMVGIFDKMSYKEQDVKREIFFKLVQNPNQILEVEI